MMIAMRNWKSVTKDNYKRHANDFALCTKIYTGKTGLWIEEFLSQLKKKSVVLDVGCGAGRDTQSLCQRGMRVISIDFSEKLLAIAQKNAPKAKFMVMDFENLTFKKDYFGGVWANASLLHLPKKSLQKVLNKLYDILKTDGIFFSTFRVGIGARFTNEKRGNATLKRFYQYYQEDELLGMLKESGFILDHFELDAKQNENDWIAFFCKKTV